VAEALALIWRYVTPTYDLAFSFRNKLNRSVRRDERANFRDGGCLEEGEPLSLARDGIETMVNTLGIGQRGPSYYVREFADRW
jgi:hypothetical protein